ncbi:MAG: aminotransferase class V-fold PLP-dependent enzyme [Beijerinckiaceae bacterium]
MPSEPVILPGRVADGFSRFRAAAGTRLHFAAHSHHWWPDVTRDAQQACWDDGARFTDDKWQHILGEIWSEVKAAIARHLRLPDPDTLVVAPNTHELLNRLLSCFPADKPVTIVATDSEFHSFRRQIDRLVEDGVVKLKTVAAQPFSTLHQRIIEAVRQTPATNMVFVSHVLFNSGFAMTDLEALVRAVKAPGRFIAIDGYHHFMARACDLSTISDDVFYIAGGYKYAMAGEGCCFMHAPPGFGARPRNTGWYAGFASLSAQQGEVGYAAGGWRFMGATFDPSGLYRLHAVMRWLDQEKVDAAAIHAHALALQHRFMAGLPERAEWPMQADRLVVPLEERARGNFLTFAHPAAAQWYQRLHDAGIVTDVRADRLRFGFGIYQTHADVDALLDRLHRLG